jgi:hypothetical protein
MKADKQVLLVSLARDAPCLHACLKKNELTTHCGVASALERVAITTFFDRKFEKVTLTFEYNILFQRTTQDLSRDF